MGVRGGVGLGGGGGSLVKQEGVDLCSHERGGVVGIKFREDVAHVLSAQLLDYETEKPVETNRIVNTFRLSVIIGLTCGMLLAIAGPMLPLLSCEYIRLTDHPCVSGKELYLPRHAHTLSSSTDSAWHFHCEW